jgi:hypothetical protein
MLSPRVLEEELLSGHGDSHYFVRLLRKFILLTIM